MTRRDGRSVKPEDATAVPLERRRVERILARVRDGGLTVDAAAGLLAGLPGEDLGFAMLDHGRELRTGVPEAVLAQGKTADQVLEIAAAIHRRAGRVLVTRVAPQLGRRLVREMRGVVHDTTARLVIAGSRAPRAGAVAVACAGTADLPVAEEAALTLEFLGVATVRAYDVGVAGLHRLLGHLERLRSARAIVVVAGMEGALPSVVAGLVEAPVVAVPTSVGYGASLGGLAALLAMLNSCAAGVSVVNIDNGFGAACVASRIVGEGSTHGGGSGPAARRAGAGRPGGMRTGARRTSRGRRS